MSLKADRTTPTTINEFATLLKEICPPGNVALIEDNYFWLEGNEESLWVKTIKKDGRAVFACDYGDIKPELKSSIQRWLPNPKFVDEADLSRLMRLVVRPSQFIIEDEWPQLSATTCSSSEIKKVGIPIKFPAKGS